MTEEINKLTEIKLPTQISLDDVKFIFNKPEHEIGDEDLDNYKTFVK